MKFRIISDNREENNAKNKWTLRNWFKTQTKKNWKMSSFSVCCRLIWMQCLCTTPACHRKTDQIMVSFWGCFWRLTSSKRFVELERLRCFYSKFTVAKFRLSLHPYLNFVNHLQYSLNFCHFCSTPSGKMENLLSCAFHGNNQKKRLDLNLVHFFLHIIWIKLLA